MDPWANWNTIALMEPQDLAPEQRALYALGWLRTEVNNGGFDQFFLNEAGDVAHDAVAAARSAGAPDLAELVAEAMSVLGPNYSVDRVQRQTALLALNEDDRVRLGQLDDRYYEMESSMDLDTVMEHFVSGA